ncbi:MAG: hypothetical protein ACT4PG_01020 [Panacagrimonas sp.]
MKRILMAAALLAVASSASAESRIGSSLSTLVSGNTQFPGGLAAAGQLFLAGQVTPGFAAGRNGFSGFAVIATDGTPLAPLGLAAEQQFLLFYDALLPLYLALDEPAAKLAALGKPVAQPLSDGVALFADVFSGVVSQLPPLPGLD